MEVLRTDVISVGSQVVFDLVSVSIDAVLYTYPRSRSQVSTCGFDHYSPRSAELERYLPYGNELSVFRVMKNREYNYQTVFMMDDGDIIDLARSMMFAHELLISINSYFRDLPKVENLPIPSSINIRENIITTKKAMLHIFVKVGSSVTAVLISRSPLSDIAGQKYLPARI